MAKMLCIRSAAPNRFQNGLESGRVYEVNAHPQQCACTGQEARAAAEGAVFNRKTRVNRQCCGTKIAMVYVPWGMSRFVPWQEKKLKVTRKEVLELYAAPPAPAAPVKKEGNHCALGHGNPCSSSGVRRHRSAQGKLASNREASAQRPA